MLYISDFFPKNSNIGIGKLYFYAIQYYVSYSSIYNYIILLCYAHLQQFKQAGTYYKNIRSLLRKIYNYTGILHNINGYIAIIGNNKM